VGVVLLLLLLLLGVVFVYHKVFFLSFFLSFLLPFLLSFFLAPRDPLVSDDSQTSSPFRLRYPLFLIPKNATQNAQQKDDCRADSLSPKTPPALRRIPYAEVPSSSSITGVDPPPALSSPPFWAHRPE
jgi:hypothetical protein